MDRPNKKQKVGDDTSTYKEEVLFNSDTLSKIICYLPSVDVFNLALTCKQFGISTNEKPSLIEDSARIAVRDIATEEELATLPYYEGKNALADYHYLQFTRGPLTFDQLVGGIEYANIDDKSCVKHRGQNGSFSWETALSNNILRSGKHYVTFELSSSSSTVTAHLGVMRPGQANQNAKEHPTHSKFFDNFSQRLGGDNNNNNIQCCMYDTINGLCYSRKGCTDCDPWDGTEVEEVFPGDEIGMLLDLDEGSLSVYKNGRNLGVMKRGLAGEYCWIASMSKGAQVTIKRGTVPPS